MVWFVALARMPNGPNNPRCNAGYSSVLFIKNEALVNKSFYLRRLNDQLFIQFSSL